MIEIVIALIGSSLSGLWDLFTTEVPDEIPYLMILSGIVFWFVNAVATGDFYPLFISLSIGTSVLLIGLFLYSKGQWGEADAWIMASIAFLIPLHNNSIFMANFLPNMIIVSAVYMIIYTAILGIRNRKIFYLFLKDIKNSWKIVFAVPLLYLIVSMIIFMNYNTEPIITTFLIILFLMFFWRYGIVVEKNLFRKKIRASELKAGDVLEDMKWVGLTEDDIKKLKKSRKFVVIKEGIRFVPVFPISLVITLLYGNLFLLFLV